MVCPRHVVEQNKTRKWRMCWPFSTSKEKWAANYRQGKASTANVSSSKETSSSPCFISRTGKFTKKIVRLTSGLSPMLQILQADRINSEASINGANPVEMRAVKQAWNLTQSADLTDGLAGRSTNICWMLLFQMSGEEGLSSERQFINNTERN